MANTEILGFMSNGDLQVQDLGSKSDQNKKHFRQGLTSLKTLSTRSGWPQIQRDPPASVFQVLRLKICSITPE